MQAPETYDLDGILKRSSSPAIRASNGVRCEFSNTGDRPEKAAHFRQDIAGLVYTAGHGSIGRWPFIRNSFQGQQESGGNAP
jgi:hypothetical protein